MWKEVIDLISVENIQNKRGFKEEHIKNIKENVFANKLSVKRIEFYQAFANGVKVDIVFEIKKIEFEDETRVRFDKKSYDIVRTYEKGENIELLCRCLNNTCVV